MTKGEFESMGAAYKATPEFVPKPIAYGTYTTIPNTHFFLCEFRQMTGEIPEPGPLAAPLSKLHKLGDSPTGKFGFPVTTYPGNLPQYVGWEDSWETFFAKSMRQALNFEIGRRGPTKSWTCSRMLCSTRSSLGCSDLLRAAAEVSNPHSSMGTSGSQTRALMPKAVSLSYLMHAAFMRTTNVSLFSTVLNLVIDKCVDEFGQWRPICNKFGSKYLAAYNSLHVIEISEPMEDFEGRLDLYRL